MIASDGIWDVMSSAEVVGFILHQNGEIKDSAEKLVKEARSRWEENTRNKKVKTILSSFVIKWGTTQQQKKELMILLVL